MRARRRSKRALDMIAAAVGLVVLAPVFLLVALLIKLDGAGPVFFRQQRVGLRGKLFVIWKLRTMVPDAGRHGPLITRADDRRITRVGHWLRKTKLDELPQLVNVLRGEMSLVGPRPEVPRYVAYYSDAQRRVLDLVPGITDPASIRYRRESELLLESLEAERTYVDEIMPDKIRLNLEYAERATLGSDLLVILATLLPLGRLPMGTGDIGHTYARAKTSDGRGSVGE